MTNEALNKIKQIHPQFKKITAQLNKLLGIEFGYMKVFKDGSYFKIMDNLECMEKWVTEVEESHIFCERNVTTYFDGDYNFTLWPKEPTCKAMEIYKAYGVWNGITVSKMSKNYVELYWFTKREAEDGWHKWFIRNKQVLLWFITNFDKFKEQLNTLDSNSQNHLLKFYQGFMVTLKSSEYIAQESSNIIKLIAPNNSNSICAKYAENIVCLSQRETQVLSIICHGYTVKIAAQKLCISTRTAQHYIERIKHKTGLHSKVELAHLYETLLR